MGAEEAIAIGQTLCHALSAVHGAGLLHRDIKARNVMRDSGGHVMLMDLGAGRDLYAEIAANTPLRRWGRPQDVAGAAVWLASPAAAFVTGQAVNVNGGAVG